MTKHCAKLEAMSDLDELCEPVAEPRRLVRRGRNVRFALSLFSGAGGMDIGVTQAGFDVLSAIEIDHHASETLRHNIKKRKEKTSVIECNIRAIDPEGLRDSLGLQEGELDLLCGGPPCQAFSQIGKQDSLRDERGILLFQMVRFAHYFRPKAILIEQVKGLLSAKDLHGVKGGVFTRLIDELEKLDYVPKWKTVLAADYGVPQLRQRVFIVAMRKPNDFSFPNPTHCPPGHVNSLFPLPPYVTVGDVLKGLGKPSGKECMTREDNHVDVTPERDRERIEEVPEGEYLAAQLHLPHSIRRNLTKKDTTKYLRLSRSRPSLTLRCGEIFYHPTEARYLTPREYMRIHGYPDDYSLTGPVRSRSGVVRDLDQHRQVANSVPPPVARILATEIREQLDAKNL